MFGPEIDNKITFNRIIGQPSWLTEFNTQNSDFDAKVVAITGGAGSIGFALASLLTNNTNAKIWLIDNDESRVHTAQLKLNLVSGNRVDFLVIDIKDSVSLSLAFTKINPDIIIHTAALKHVSILERQPREAFLTNVVGLVNVINYIKEHNKTRLCFISTDKAVNPTSVLGKTKLIGEYLVAGLSINSVFPQKERAHNVIRFGNVFMSRGSVIETFIFQLMNGLPLTITSTSMERYFIDLSQAAALICDSISQSRPGINILDMGKSVLILDVASHIARELGIENFETVEIGEKPGEKVSEELMSSAELEKFSRTENGVLNVGFSRYLMTDEVPVNAADDMDAKLIIERLLNAAHNLG